MLDSPYAWIGIIALAAVVAVVGNVGLQWSIEEKKKKEAIQLASDLIGAELQDNLFLVNDFLGAEHPGRKVDLRRFSTEGWNILAQSGLVTNLDKGRLQKVVVIYSGIALLESTRKELLEYARSPGGASGLNDRMISENRKSVEVYFTRNLEKLRSDLAEVSKFFPPPSDYVPYTKST